MRGSFFMPFFVTGIAHFTYDVVSEAMRLLGAPKI